MRAFFRATVACAAGLILFAATAVRAQAHGSAFLRDPSVSRTHIAFVYAGYVWVSTRDGRNVRRLTRGGREAKPAISPDGSQVAFVSDYEGVRSLYVVPISGGPIRRLTFNPHDLGLSSRWESIPDEVTWTPDSAYVLFNSRRTAFAWHVFEASTVQLFTIPAAGGPASRLPLQLAAQGAYSSDSQRLAYVPHVKWQSDWKGYRGGQTTPIRIVRLADSRIEAEIPRDNSNDFNPMWVGSSIYFLSDRNGPVTIFAYDVGARKVKQVVHNSGLDIKSAAASADAIVYEQFGVLHLLDLRSGNNETLDIRPELDDSQARPHLQTVGPAQLSFPRLSPQGDRVMFGVRGEIVTAPVANGVLRNLTNTANVSERDPAWSPDGRSVAYFSDESGEYALHIRSLDSSGSVTKINLGEPPAFYYSPRWSPDGSKIAFTDQRLNYWYVDVRRRTPIRVDTDLYNDPSQLRRMVWSADSRWIAYTRLLPNHLHAVFVYSIAQGETHQLTDGKSDVLHVTFDKGGEYIYFTASTDVGPSAGWLEMTAMDSHVTRRVYAMALNKDAASEKLLADASEARVIPLPIQPANYYDLFAGRSGVLFLVQGPEVEPVRRWTRDGPVSMAVNVLRFDPATGAIGDVVKNLTSYGAQDDSAFQLSLSGEKMLYLARGRWWIGDAAGASAHPGPHQGDTALELQNLQLNVDPRAEWAHMFYQVWRGERDFFYDEGLSGARLMALQERYAPYLAKITHREDLNYLFREMLGNLSVSHLNVSGGDIRLPQRVKVGLLGADFAVEENRYRFQRIFAGDPWNPEMRAPLVTAGAQVHSGEFLLAVNGQEVRSDVDVYSFFVGTAGESAMLTVGPNPDGSHSRQVAIVPIDDETPLRNYAWEESNRRLVDQATGGRVAYIYLSDTNMRGYPAFKRQFFAQIGKDAAIIDARFNGGGVIPDYVIDWLKRPLMSFWFTRYGADFTEPQMAIFGPKVMLVNEMAGSGGDSLAWMFRKVGLGQLIGKRTWGGLVGIPANPNDLLDGGSVTTPDLAFYGPNGQWEIENRGVTPDIEVEQDPAAMRDGHDPQLEKAVTVIMEALRKQPPTPPPGHPPFPEYRRNLR